MALSAPVGPRQSSSSCSRSLAAFSRPRRTSSSSQSQVPISGAVPGMGVTIFSSRVSIMAESSGWTNRDASPLGANELGLQRDLIGRPHGSFQPGRLDAGEGRQHGDHGAGPLQDLGASRLVGQERAAAERLQVARAAQVREPGGGLRERVVGTILKYQLDQDAEGDKFP